MFPKFCQKSQIWGWFLKGGIPCSEVFLLRVKKMTSACVGIVVCCDWSISKESSGGRHNNNLTACDWFISFFFICDMIINYYLWYRVHRHVFWNRDPILFLQVISRIYFNLYQKVEDLLIQYTYSLNKT